MRFEELEPVAVGVVRVEASVPGEVVIPLHGHASIAEVIREVVDARDQHAGVGFAGRSEVGLDTEMDLPATTAEPATTARREHGRLLELQHAERVTVEAASQILGTRGDRELDVVEAAEGE